MMQTRYRPARTLTRRLCRLPGQDRLEFNAHVTRLRQHFEAFNVNTAELCQWFMGLRKRFGDPSAPASFGVLGDFLLEPSLEGIGADEKEADQWRLLVFDHVARFRLMETLVGSEIPPPLADAIGRADAALTPTARRLFERLAGLEPAHRMILLKAAAEWVVARYRRGVENWLRQRAEWEAEKQAWEKQHPNLAPHMRDRFTEVFKETNDPDDEAEAMGVRRKNPRICPYERLKANTDSCLYAGEKGHGPRCWKFAQFVRASREKNSKFNKKMFVEKANLLLAYGRERGWSKPSSMFLSGKAADIMFKEKDAMARPHILAQFKQDWQAYQSFMGLNEQTLAEYGCLSHCATIGNKVFDKSECLWNPHTDLCKQYHRRLTAAFSDEELKLETDYRAWRSLYLAGPSKPSFKYPSARDLPMPKIFGKDYYEVDFAQSVLRLRLEDMRAGEWLEFGFAPWPKGYSPSRKQIAEQVSSIHVQFSGNRVRVGFHFAVEFAASRIGVLQDELDELRSRVYPRQAQDREFVDTARVRVLESFDGDAKQSLRVLTVDMGMTGAHVAIFEGTRCVGDAPLKIDKVDRLYDAFPERPEPKAAPTKKGKSSKKKKDPEVDKAIEFKPIDTRGLRKEHVGRHLTSIARGAATLAEHRADAEEETVSVLRASDFRGLKRHIAWMARDWARLNAKQIVNAAEAHRCDLIVFESLRGKRVPGFDQMGADNERKKQEALLYAYGRVRRKVAEKAVERGMRVITAPYHCSSKVCVACGRKQENRGRWLKNKNNKKFICEHKGCRAFGKPVDSDANAARVIGEVFWGTIILPEPK